MVSQKNVEINSHVIFKDQLSFILWIIFKIFDWVHIVTIYCNKYKLQILKYYSFMKFEYLEHDLVDFRMALFA